ncbi:MAG: RHS repeat-associated core domain-containing protein [Bacteroidales bacterium]|nr:RHS repeat-associated core domain-containing protein [Bacteroidales bacterium]
MAELDIPFYTLTGRELCVPIGLHYTCGAVKLDEIGGIAGLGWTLQAGGCVTRTVMDMPDEFCEAGFMHRMPSEGMLAALEGLSTADTVRTYLESILSRECDAKRDLYHYNVCGLSGSFLLLEDGTVHHLSGDGVRITCRRAADHAVEAFILTGPDGTVYELSEKETAAHEEIPMDPGPLVFWGHDAEWSATTAWHLTRITSCSGGETALLTYANGGTWNSNVYEDVLALIITKGVSEYEWDSRHAGCDIINNYATKVLSSISLAGFTASFSYTSSSGSHYHTDMNGSSAQNFPASLASISVSAPGGGNTPLAQMVLGTQKDLFDGRIILKDLCLYRNGTLDDRWDFAYNTRQRTVSRLSQDWYGYYNAEKEFGDTTRINISPYSLQSTVPVLSHGFPNDVQASYMALLAADHDGARTEFTYEGNIYTPGTSESVCVGIRVKEIRVYDVDSLRHKRTFTYEQPVVDGPWFPTLREYTTMDVKQKPVIINNNIVGEKYQWAFYVHETPVTDGPSLQSTRVVYGKVTEDISDGTASVADTARTVRYFYTSGVRRAETSVIGRFPSQWAGIYNSLTYNPGVDPWAGVRETVVDGGPADRIRLMREEIYARPGQENEHVLVSSTEYEYAAAAREPVLAEYRAHRIMRRIQPANVQMSDYYHYPVFITSCPDRKPVRTVRVGYHPGGNDTLVIRTDWTVREALDVPCRISSMTTEIGGQPRRIAYTYADTWTGCPSWVDTLRRRHCLSVPLKTAWCFRRYGLPVRDIGDGGHTPILPEVYVPYKEERTGYGWFSLGGDAAAARLLPASHLEYTLGRESWREEVLSRDILGQVAALKERGKPGTVVLWSYGGLYPVAFIENAGMAAVQQALGGAVAVNTLTTASAPSAAQLASLDALRTALPSAHVTTFTHQPGIGMTSRTDPAGIRTTFSYDSGGRLACVRDADGNKMAEYQYSLLNNGGPGRLHMRSRHYRTSSGSSWAEDVRWWNTLGLVTEDIAIGASGDGRDLVTAYGADFLLHEDARTWRPYPASGTGGVFQTFAADSAALWHGSPLAYSLKRYECSSRDRFLATALPGYAGAHEDVLSEDVPADAWLAAFPPLKWEQGTAVVDTASYDGALVEDNVVDADGRRRSRLRDHAGRVLSASFGTAGHPLTDPAPTRYAYDEWDRLCAVAGGGVNPGDSLSLWRCSYDTLGRVASRGIPGSVREYYTYDAEDRIVAVRRGPYLLETDYDAFSRPVRSYLTKNGGQRVSLEEHCYDSYPAQSESLLEIADPDGIWSGPTRGLETYTEVAEIGHDGTISGNVSRLFLYDGKGRLSRMAERFNGGLVIVTDLAYNFPGEVIRRTARCLRGGSETERFEERTEYDVRGRVLSMAADLSSGGVIVARDSTTFSYDTQGRLSGTVSHPLTSGGVALSTTDTYTMQGHLATRTVNRGTNQLFKQWLRYDNPSMYDIGPSWTGHITEKAESWYFPEIGGGVEPTYAFEGYAYDCGGRLSRVSESTSYATDYRYDARGNLLCAVRTLAGVTCATDSCRYAGDRLDTLVRSPGWGWVQGTLDFVHDSLGRMTFDGLSGLEIGYTHLDRPARVVEWESGEIRAKYRYLADGTKSAALDMMGEGLAYRGPFVFRQAWDGSLALESAACSSGRLSAAAGVVRYVRDHLGSVRAAVGQAGALFVLADYDAWGGQSVPYGGQDVLSALPAGTTFREGFTGQEDQNPDFGFNATDHGARFYPSALRRWHTPDSKSWEQPGLSPYAYCNNDPVNFIDPEGTEIYVADAYQQQFMDDLKKVFGDKIKMFSFNSQGLVSLQGEPRDFKRGLSWNQRAAFNGLYSAMTDEIETSIVYADRYWLPSQNRIIDVVAEEGGGLFSPEDNTIVIAPSAGAVKIDVTFQYDEEGHEITITEPMSIQQTTTTILFHEIRERKLKEAPDRTSVIDYENHIRRILALPKRPYDVRHKKSGPITMSEYNEQLTK